MNLVLTMAGSYQRFLDEKINVPKYLLPWSDGTILGEIIAQFSRNFRWKSVIGVMASADHRWQPITTSIIRKANAEFIQVYGVKTDSQIATARIALGKHFSLKSEKIVFANIDTILLGRDWQYISDQLDESDGYVDVFHSGSPNYSYVLPSKGMVDDMYEKNIVSNHASSGLYAFADSIELIRHLEGLPNSRYFSEVIAAAIKNKKNFRCGELHNESDTLVLGTPLEYFENLIIYGSDLK